ncbi:MAG: hypothetical protein AAF492_00805, partial [Verrucomicrobiota bacterium]
MKRYLFMADDGWRYERRESLKYLNDKLDMHVATHDPGVAKMLEEDFEVVLLPLSPLKGKLSYTLVMFFARELDSMVVKTVQRIRFHFASPLMKLLHGVRRLAGALGLRRYTYARALKFLYRGSKMHTELLKQYDVLVSIPVNTIDKRIEYEAMALGLDVICYVFSWDNPMKDSEMSPDATKYLVWNRETKDELCERHDIEPERVGLVGPVQFDYLLEREPARE